MRASRYSIQTDKNGAFEIQSLFKEHLKREVTFSTTNNIRSYFGELNINGVSVEVIGDIQKLVDGEWELAPILNEIIRYISVDNIVLPVLSLEYEAEAYRKLGREEKANIIKEHLKDQ
ncbi:nucleotidyltransferase domain-containing protein [Paenibacillus sp. NPDC056579]|uniref:nucleotidyltransferase domain-containing protein n=1 Tax=Paenibacillus sp. NPDC056579 TaxID=3345871 RepID=UPI0036956D31